MAQHKSAKKRIRTNERKRLKNQADLSKIKTLIKQVYSSDTKAAAESTLKDAISILDRAASNRQIPRNNVARKKSSLTRFVNRLDEKK